MAANLGSLKSATNSVVSALPWLTDPTMTRPGLLRLKVAQWICLGGASLEGRHQAPCPATAQYALPCAGICTTPRTGLEPLSSAMLTVNSPLRLRNSLVPSSGSTHHEYWYLCRVFSCVW